MMMRKMMLLAGASMVLLLTGCDKQVALPEKESTASTAVAGKWH
jgi:hypothetical protein